MHAGKVFLTVENVYLMGKAVSYGTILQKLCHATFFASNDSFCSVTYKNHLEMKMCHFKQNMYPAQKGNQI